MPRAPKFLPYRPKLQLRIGRSTVPSPGACLVCTLCVEPLQSMCNCQGSHLVKCKEPGKTRATALPRRPDSGSRQIRYNQSSRLKLFKLICRKICCERLTQAVVMVMAGVWLELLQLLLMWRAAESLKYAGCQELIFFLNGISSVSPCVCPAWTRHGGRYLQLSRGKRWGGRERKGAARDIWEIKGCIFQHAGFLRCCVQCP